MEYNSGIDLCEHTRWHVRICVCPQVDLRGRWAEGVAVTVSGGGHSSAQPWAVQGDMLATVSSSAADSESQDPDSTNHLESDIPRDYFLKCK